VYQVSLPNDVATLLEYFSVAVSFGLASIATTPLECVGLAGYQPRLVFWMVAPVVFTLVVVGLALSSEAWRRLSRSRKAAATADEGSRGSLVHHQPQRKAYTLEKALQPALVLMFVLYPRVSVSVRRTRPLVPTRDGGAPSPRTSQVTTVAFEGFPCYWFAPVGDAPARGWLRADVSIECDSPEHASVMAVAWVAIVVYPIGIWLGCVALLWKASAAIVSGEPTPFSRSISLLHREYKATTYWWELMEMLRKFFLVGLFVVLEPGTILQITCGTIVCATYLMVQLQADPYKQRSDNYLAVASSFALLMVLHCAVGTLPQQPSRACSDPPAASERVRRSSSTAASSSSTTR
jgi:uncharacterized membrane protein YhaH (DUF805 family)